MEDSDKLRACLQRLKEDYREVILLRDFSGCSWETVAEEMGPPTADAARAMYGRARAKLAAQMME